MGLHCGEGLTMCKNRNKQGRGPQENILMSMQAGQWGNRGTMGGRMIRMRDSGRKEVEGKCGGGDWGVRGADGEHGVEDGGALAGKWSTPGLGKDRIGARYGQLEDGSQGRQPHLFTGCCRRLNQTGPPISLPGQGLRTRIPEICSSAAWLLCPRTEGALHDLPGQGGRGPCH